MPDIIPLRTAAPLSADLTSSPLVVDARRLGELLCCGIRTIRTWDAAGRLPAPLRIGGRVVWRVDELRDWIDAGAPDHQTWAAIRAARR